MNINLSVDLMGTSETDFGSFVNAMAEQGGVLFFNSAVYAYLNEATPWETYQGTLPASGWIAVNAQGGPVQGASLNLTSSGAPIIFGIGTDENSSQPIQNTYGVDNISYAINVPEPSTWALLGFGATGMLAAATRKKVIHRQNSSVLAGFYVTCRFR